MIISYRVVVPGATPLDQVPKCPEPTVVGSS